MNESGVDLQRVARSILETLPIMARALASRMRCIGEGTVPGHFALLHAVALQPLSLGELAERLQVSAPTMSVTVQTLATRGWLRRERSAQDRRIVMVHTTPAGMDMLGQMYREAEALMQDILEPLTADELGRVCDGMETLRRLVETEPMAPMDSAALGTTTE